MPPITAIHIHPIKSCRAVPVESVEVTPRGLAGDRLFQVVDADGQPVTQRQHPRMATVQPTLVHGGLHLQAPGVPQLDVARPSTNDTTVSSLLGVSVEAGDAGDEAATWFSDLLGAPVRLVGMTDQSVYRLPMPGGDMDLSWADGSSVLVANDASLRWLAERSDEPFGMDRFRPNICVDTDPWVEDTWRELTIGTARLGVGLAWPRCTIPQVDQMDGTRHKEPARVLKAHRWCTNASAAPEAFRPILEGNALFGIGCSVLEAGATIAVGDTLVIDRTADPIIPAPTD